MKAIILILLLLTNVCNARIYEEVDAAGNTVFTDSPSTQAPAASTIETTPPATASKPALASPTPAINKIVKQPYTAFTMASPYDQQNFHNQREITVLLQSTPLLQTGDKVQLYVDNKPYGSAQTDPTLTLKQLDRGSHSLYAALLAEGSAVQLKTTPVTIHVHYAVVKK